MFVSAPARFVLAAMLLSIPSVAQISMPKIGSKDKDKDKEKEKATQRATKEANRYEKLRTYSMDKYAQDPEFKDQVDEHFGNVQRDHSEEAYIKNTAPPARIRFVADGDAVRLETGIYDNKLVQEYVNRIGQSVVPENSEKLYAYRLIAHPVPFAETLSTGTIYVSTGLASMVQNEAQLAYILAHEMAHVHLGHWLLKSQLQIGQEHFNEGQERKRSWLTLAAVAAGATVGGLATDSVGGAFGGAALGGLGGWALGKLFIKGLYLDWDKVQEDQADKLAFEVILKRNYDVREVPKLYAALNQAVVQDARIGLGFMGSRRRVNERLASVNELIGQSGLQSRELILNGSEFERATGELKRDNGIISYYYDMFNVAKGNLEYAIKVRSTDPAAHYYYAKTLRLLGRSPQELTQANQAMTAAMALDTRNRFYGAHLFQALDIIRAKEAARNPDVIRELTTYLNQHAAVAIEDTSMSVALPANVDDIYQYLTEAGEPKWKPVVTQQAGAYALAVGAAQSGGSLRTGRAEGVDPSLLVGNPGGGLSQVNSAVGGAAAGAAVGSYAGTGGAVAGAVAGGAVGATQGAKKPAAKKK